MVGEEFEALETSKTDSCRKRKRKSNLWLNAPKRKKTVPVSTPVANSNTAKPTSCSLRHAPRKAKSKKVPKSKKRLFNHGQQESLSREMIDLLPIVLKKLQCAGLLGDFCTLIRLISKDKFPLHNISFLLLLDVVRWYSVPNTSNMFYSEQCLKFWKVVYRLFHGKVLRFMSGQKSGGQILDATTSRGNFDPQITSINFAVPSISTVRSFESFDMDIPKEIPPGIIRQAIEMKPKNKSYILSVDGKKLAPGLNEDNGDQDLFGHEEFQTLEQTKVRIEKEVEAIEMLQKQWAGLNPGEKRDRLKEIVFIVSNRIKDLRELFVKQKLALKKFHKEAGEDWKKSKYLHAISSVQSLIYLLRSVVKRLLDVNNSLLSVGASLNVGHHSFVHENTLDAHSQRNWVTLKEPDHLPIQYQDQIRAIKQRSDIWFSRRQEFKLTGSTLYEGIGLDKLKTLQRHYDKVIRQIEPEEVSEEVKKRMAHGTSSEIHAVATLVGKILPFYCPSLSYIEEGAHEIKSGDNPFILVSPDGSLGQVQLDSCDMPTPEIGCEFKCPVANEYKTPVHYDLPIRYVPQVLAEMASMGVSSLIYLSWTEESSTAFRLTFDAELWEMIMTEAESIYTPIQPKRPTRISTAAKSIREKIQLYRERNVEFLCEVPSVKATSDQLCQTHDETPYVFPIFSVGVERQVEEIETVLSNAASSLREAHQICRKKATEVLVWLLSDSDRSWDPEIPHALPVSYAMKGYSLGTKVMREMHDHVMQACSDGGLDIVCSCFDGQWINLANRDKNERPLTALQLQRDIWKEACYCFRQSYQGG